MKKTTTNYLLAGFGLFFFGILLFSSCSKESQEYDAIREVQYKIAASATSITQGEAVTYGDESKNVTSRAWTFEGGDITTSDQAEVVVNYAEPGSYPAKLVVNFSDGTSEERTILTKVEPFVETAFAASKTTIIVGSSISFENLSSEYADSLNWEFEGGNIENSSEANPTVRYDQVGVYSVTLNASRTFPLHTDVETKTGLITVVDVNVISPVSTNMSGFGSTLTLTYDEELQAVTDEEFAKYSVTVDGEPSEIADITLSDDNLSLIITLATGASEGQVVLVDYTGDGFAATGSLLAGLIELNVANTVINLFPGNMDFEENAVGEFPTGWGTWNPTQSINNNQNYKTTDLEFVSGSKSVEVSYDGSGDTWIFDNKVEASVVPDANYIVTFWAKSTLDGVALDLRTIEKGWATANNPDDFVLGTEWQQYSFEFTANDAGNLNRVIWWQISGPQEIFEVYVDDLKLYNID